MAYFASISCSMVSGYSAIYPKIEWEKKDNIVEDIYHVYKIFWKWLLGDCLQCVKESTNKVEKNAVVVVCTDSHCKEEVDYLFIFIYTLFIVDKKNNTMYAIKIAMLIIIMLIDVNFQKITC